MSRWFDDIRIGGRLEGVPPPSVRVRPKTGACPGAPNYRAKRHGCAGATPSQDEVLKIITDGLANGRIIKRREIANRMGWKAVQSATDCLRKLGAAGRLPSGYPRDERMWKD